jgi:hypothetical protein
MGDIEDKEEGGRDEDNEEYGEDETKIRKKRGIKRNGRYRIGEG